MNQAISYKLKYFQTLIHPEARDLDFMTLQSRNNSWKELERKAELEATNCGGMIGGFGALEGLGTNTGLAYAEVNKIKSIFSRGGSELGQEDRVSAEETTSAFRLHHPHSPGGILGLKPKQANEDQVTLPKAEPVTEPVQTEPAILHKAKSAEHSVEAFSDDSSSCRSRKARKRKDSTAESKTVPFVDYEALLSQSYATLKTRAEELHHVQSLLLMKAIMAIFEGHLLTGEELAYLSETDMLVLSALFSKKCKITFDVSNPRDKIAEFINEHLHYYKHKRNEENYKLIFKKAVKHISKKIKPTLVPVPKNKLEMAYQFYLKYFREPFKANGLDKELGIVEEEKRKNNPDGLLLVGIL